MIAMPLNTPHVVYLLVGSNDKALHDTTQHSTAQHSTAQHSTAQHSTAQHLPNLSACSRRYLKGAGLGRRRVPCSRSSMLFEACWVLCAEADWQTYRGSSSWKAMPVITPATTAMMLHAHTAQESQTYVCSSPWYTPSILCLAASPPPPRANTVHCRYVRRSSLCIPVTSPVTTWNSVSLRWKAVSSDKTQASPVTGSFSPTTDRAGNFLGVLGWFWMYKLAGHVYCIGRRPLRTAQPYFQHCFHVKPSYRAAQSGTHRPIATGLSCPVSCRARPMRAPRGSARPLAAAHPMAFHLLPVAKKTGTPRAIPSSGRQQPQQQATGCELCHGTGEAS